jgi:imidazoleglycerol-phosphate dehydratase / histidinol-phosphatase
MTGLVDDFVKRAGVEPGASLMIGDRESDRQFAKHLGVRFVRTETNGRFPRFASLRRRTEETDISVFLNLDGSGENDISTGIAFFDHMLDLLASHALVDLSLRAVGDVRIDEHHTVEDTGLALGAAMDAALSDRRGIERYGFLLPMDESLVEAAVDLSGRPCLVFEGRFCRERVGELPTEMVPHFFESFAQSLRCGLHLTIRRGRNEHHKIEATFKAVGRCLRQAFRLSPHERGVPSTKGLL